MMPNADGPTKFVTPGVDVPIAPDL